MYRKEWECCDSVTETDAWEPEECPFCTAPPQREWVSLTDDEIRECEDSVEPFAMELARAIEAKLKEKNNGAA